MNRSWVSDSAMIPVLLGVAAARVQYSVDLF